MTLSGVKMIRVNLAEKKSIEAAVDECGGPVTRLLSCAGVADGTPGIERIDFIGHRHMIDRMLERGACSARLARSASSRLPRGSAGRRGSRAEGAARDGDFDRAVEWAQKNEKANYYWMKQAVCAYVASEAFPLLKRGIRINATCPGPTDTPLAQANKETWLGFGADYRKELGIEASTPKEQAYPLLFLCSDCGLGHQRHHLDHRRRLHALRHHGLVPERHHDGEGADGQELSRVALLRGETLAAVEPDRGAVEHGRLEDRLRQTRRTPRACPCASGTRRPW